MVFAAVLLVRSGFRVRPRRLTIYAILTIGLGLASAGEYTLWDSLDGGLSIDTRLILYTVLLPVGAIGFLLLDSARKPRLSILQFYIVGAVGAVLTDLFRIFSGALNVSPEIIGAAGPQDGVFLDGFLLILGYIVCATAYVVLLQWKSRTSMPTTATAPVADHALATPQGRSQKLGYIASDGYWCR